MERNGDLVQSINNLGYDYDDINQSNKNYLEIIYGYREEIIADVETSKKSIQKNYFTISEISKRLECSRTTIYNNPVIKDYIISLHEELNDLNPYSIIKSLKEEIKELDRKLELMKQRDVELELLRLDNLELKENMERNKTKNIYNLNYD